MNAISDPFNNDFHMDEQIEENPMDKKLIAQELLCIAKSLLAKFYVGIKNGKREVFESDEKPTKESHGKKYKAVSGPYDTEEGANFSAKQEHIDFRKTQVFK